MICLPSAGPAAFAVAFTAFVTSSLTNSSAVSIIDSSRQVPSTHRV